MTEHTATDFYQGKYLVYLSVKSRFASSNTAAALLYPTWGQQRAHSLRHF